ncbi:MAG: hypothetical protein IT306_27320 [Chloroflexi bacterium]|nr:hypothetical protein [Chloroflexota bacterium]
MLEHDRDQPTADADDAGERRSRASGITGLSDLLPDWILPQESKQHLRNARKEMLLAARTMIDRAIERQEAGPAPKRTVNRVEID